MRGEEAPASSADSGGDSGVDIVFDQVYAELRQMAAQLMADERAEHTLQPTALVHEAYLKSLGSQPPSGSRAQFFFAAARAMRQILVDHARARLRVKRGGGRPRISSNLDSVSSGREPAEFLAVEEALRRLEAVDARAGKVAHLRLHGGLGLAEVAEMLGISTRTAEREWTFARTWLYEELR
jgi:RNA polymerase sigma factor (TIGR02999 family)